MKYNTVIVILVVIIFLLGLYLYSSSKLDQYLVFIPVTDNSVVQDNEYADNIDENKNCPNVLIKKGNQIYMYNSMNTDKELPVIFNTLDEYIMYVQHQQCIGNNCPVLYLQEENDLQGNNVLRVRPNPFNQPNVKVCEGFNGPSPSPIIDSSRESDVFNTNQYPGFDAIGLQNGVYNELDVLHQSTQSQDVYSDNPMDYNWGGVQYTNDSVNSGKYDDNMVTKPQFFQPRTQFIPGLNGMPTPPSYSDFSMPEQK